jgi:hypothetical protein
MKRDKEYAPYRRDDTTFNEKNRPEMGANSDAYYSLPQKVQ